jgi:cAMP-binding proteins - catabolite gene activator and regulatory subunit of cAMP-dependent protein kinases
MNLSALLKIQLFRSLPEPELERIFAELKVTEVHFKKGEILAMQDEPVNRLIILLTGSVKGEMTDPSGKMAKVEDIEAPSPLAILFLFGENNRFPVQATAREDGTAIIIPKQSVLKMLSLNETLLKNYLDISADFASRLSRKLHFMSFRTIRQKLAVYLTGLSRKQGSDTVTLDKSKSALAEYFGVARPSLERELTRMQEDGLIEADRRSITIRNRMQLISLTNA